MIPAPPTIVPDPAFAECRAGGRTGKLLNFSAVKGKGL
jgi:hypothetical protein